MKGDAMNHQSPTERAYPKVLIERFAYALSAFLKVANTEEERRELLQRYRRNRMRIIAGGISIGAPAANFEHIPYECYDAIARMDEAFHEMHHFRDGGAEDYCAASITSIVEKQLNSKKGKHAADKLHSKPGGSRDKQGNIRSIWASGKYTSRDICAEQECAALDMSFSAARKALRNTPDPT